MNTKESDPLPELKVHSATISEPFLDFERYSSLNKLQRLFAYVKRFIFNTRNSNAKRAGLLTVEEFRDSWHSLCIILLLLKLNPSQLNDLLTKNKPLSNKSKILSLSPFLFNKIMRVGGRLDAANYSYEKRHPILLHASHRLTTLHFEKEHVNYMHAVPLLLLS